MTPREAIQALTDAGMTQSQIVEELRAKGVVTTQGTISRISTGQFKSARFEIGIAVISLAESRCSTSRQSAA